MDTAVERSRGTSFSFFGCLARSLREREGGREREERRGRDGEGGRERNNLWGERGWITCIESFAVV